MRVIFAGTPEFAAHALQAIVTAGHDVALVLTQPDRPAGPDASLTAAAWSRAPSTTEMVPSDSTPTSKPA